MALASRLISPHLQLPVCLSLPYGEAEEMLLEISTLAQGINRQAPKGEGWSSDSRPLPGARKEHFPWN